MSADLSAEWRSHILAVRGPALVAIGVQVAQLLLRPIPSEVSPLDQALSGNTRQPRRELSVLLAAAPAVLAFGLPLAAMVLLRLPLRLSRSPPLRSRGLALGVLLAHPDVARPARNPDFFRASVCAARALSAAAYSRATRYRCGQGT